MRLYSAWAATAVASLLANPHAVTAQVGTGQTIFVGSASDVDDGIDDTAALLSAFAAAEAAGSARIIFYDGVYDLFSSATPETFSIANSSNILIEGTGTTLRLHNFDPQVYGGGYPLQLFKFDNISGSGVVMRGLEVEMVREPYSESVVVNKSSSQTWMDVEVDSARYPDLQTTFELQRVDDFDPGSGPGDQDLHGDDMHYAFSNQSSSPNAYTVTELTGSNPGTRRFRIDFANTGSWLTNLISNLPIGDNILLGHAKYRTHFFVASNCPTVDIRSVTLHDMPGMGILVRNSGDVFVDDLQLVPHMNRAMSISADGVHVTDCSGDVVLSNCSMTRMGDDGLNVHGKYLEVASITPGSPNDTVVFDVVGNHFSFEWAVGETIRGYSDQLALGPATTIESAPILLPTSGNPSTVTFDIPAGAGLSVGDYVTNVTRATDSLTVSDCHFEGNIAHGMEIRSDNTIVTDCTFVKNSSAAINVTTNVTTYGESKGAVNVTISNCDIDASNRYGDRDQGAITVRAEVFNASGQAVTAPGPVIALVTVRNTSFRNLTNEQTCGSPLCTNRAAVYFGSVLDPSIEDCTFYDLPTDLKVVILENAVSPATNGNNCLIPSNVPRFIDFEGTPIQVIGCF